MAYETKCLIHNTNWGEPCVLCKPGLRVKEVWRKQQYDKLYVMHVINQSKHSVMFEYKDFMLFKISVRFFNGKQIKYLDTEGYAKNLLDGSIKKIGRSVMEVDELGPVSPATNLTPGEYLLKEAKRIYDGFVHDVILGKMSDKYMIFVSLLLIERSNFLKELDEFLEMHCICRRGE